MKNISLRTTLIGNFVLIATVPILVIGFVALNILTANMEHEITQKNFMLAQSLTGEVERFLEQPLSILRQIQEVITVTPVITTPHINAYLDSIIRNYRFFDTLMVLDAKGKVRHLAPYNQDFFMLDMSGQEFFSRTLEHSAPYWSPTFISLQSGQPTLTVSISLEPGILVGYINLSLLHGIIEKVQIGAQGYAFIVDHDGTIIAHPNRAFVAQRVNVYQIGPIQQGENGQEGSLQYQLNGIEHIGSIAIIPPTQWFVVITQPLEEAFAPVQRIRTIFWIGIFLTTILAIFLALFSLKKTLYPLNQLTDHTNRLAAGSYHVLSFQSHYRELDELTQSFDQMIAAVKSREQALRESEERLRQVVQNMPVMMDAFDADNNILVWNRECERVTGYSAEEIMSHPNGLRLLYPNQAYYEHKMAELMERGFGFRNWEWEITSKDGSTKTIAWSNISKQYPIPGWDSWAIGVDVTEGKKAEEEVRTLNAELEQRVQQRTAELALANRELQNFTYMASHDLKTPLRGISQLAYWLTRDYGPLLDADGKRLMDLLMNRVKRLDLMIDGILQYSRVGRMMKGKEPIDMNHLVKNVQEMIPLSDQFRFIVGSELPTISGDKIGMSQIFYNLIDNAVKFMDKPQGIITIRCRNDGYWWTFSISDNGPGIAQKYYNKIFQIFQTLAPRDEHESTGMGLALVKKIVTVYGGKIWVESTVGKGSTFFFTYPKTNV